MPIQYAFEASAARPGRKAAGHEQIAALQCPARALRAGRGQRGPHQGLPNPTATSGTTEVDMTDGIIRLAGMYENTSAKTGGKYLTGRMNTGARFLAFHHPDAGDDEPDWTLSTSPRPRTRSRRRRWRRGSNARARSPHQRHAGAHGDGRSRPRRRLRQVCPMMALPVVTTRITPATRLTRRPLSRPPAPPSRRRPRSRPERR